MRIFKKANFTLLELLISFSLAAVIAGLLSLFSFRLFSMQRKIKIARKEIFSDAAVEIRLRSLLSDVLQSGPMYTENGRLFFIYEKKPDLSFPANGRLLGELFLDESRNLILISHSFAEKQPKHANGIKIRPEKMLQKEILCSKVQSLDFVFFQRKPFEFAQDRPYIKTVLWQKETPPAVFQLHIKKYTNRKEQELSQKNAFNPLILTFFSDKNSRLACFKDF